jgi:hypothetical protein
MDVDLPPSLRIDFRNALYTNTFDTTVFSACQIALPEAFSTSESSLTHALNALASKDSSMPSVCGYVFKEVRHYDTNICDARYR